MCAFFDGREKVLDVFENKIFPIKTKGTGFLYFDHSKLEVINFETNAAKITNSSCTSKGR